LTVSQYARFAAILAGFVGLGIELAAERLLAPAFGTTLDLWSIIIGLTFTALSLGYALGGRFIDRNPTHRILSYCLLSASAWGVFAGIAGRDIAGWVQNWTFDFGGVTLGIFISTLILITVPPFLLGMITPAAIRLTVPVVGAAGSSAGTIFALSTLGSLVGTFLPVLVLIPEIGVRLTFFVVAASGILGGLAGLTGLVRAPASAAEYVAEPVSAERD
jgi:MFS family permease